MNVLMYECICVSMYVYGHRNSHILFGSLVKNGFILSPYSSFLFFCSPPSSLASTSLAVPPLSSYRFHQYSYTASKGDHEKVVFKRRRAGGSAKGTRWGERVRREGEGVMEMKGTRVKGERKRGERKRRIRSRGK